MKENNWAEVINITLSDNLSCLSSKFSFVVFMPVKKRKAVDRLYGVLNKNAGLQSISENDINKASEAESDDT